MCFFDAFPLLGFAVCFAVVVFALCAVCFCFAGLAGFAGFAAT